MNINSAVIAAAVSTLIAGTTLSAQAADSQATTAKTRRWSVLVPSGAIVPTGEQRNAVKRANLSALQVAYVVQPGLAITSMFGWARSRDIATAGDPKIDMFTYDVGVELRGKSIPLSPFVGVGAGGRSYNYRSLDVDATHNAGAYVSAGGEVGVRRVRLRLEARDYVTGFKPLDGRGAARTGNDIVVMAGLRLVSR
jgi:hypothetical protein